MVASDAVQQYLDDINDDDRQYQHPVTSARAERSFSTIKRLFQVMSPGLIIESMGEIGLIDCIDFNEAGGLRLKLTDAQGIAAAAALAAIYEQSLIESTPVTFEVTL